MPAARLIGWVAASLAVAFVIRTALVAFFDRAGLRLPRPAAVPPAGQRRLLARRRRDDPGALAVRRSGGVPPRRRGSSPAAAHALRAGARGDLAGLRRGRPRRPAGRASRRDRIRPGRRLGEPGRRPRRPVGRVRPGRCRAVRALRPAGGCRRLVRSAPRLRRRGRPRPRAGDGHLDALGRRPGVPRRPAASCVGLLVPRRSDACAGRGRRVSRLDQSRSTAFVVAALVPLVVGDARTADLAGGAVPRLRRRRARARRRRRGPAVAGPGRVRRGRRRRRSAPARARRPDARRSGGRRASPAASPAPSTGVAFVRLPRAGFAAATWIVTWLMAFATQSIGWVLGGSQGIVVAGGPIPDRSLRARTRADGTRRRRLPRARSSHRSGCGLAAAREREPAARTLRRPGRPAARRSP